MSKRELALSTLIIFILSIISLFLWLFEILEIKGWYSLDWLDGNLYSPYIVALIVVFAFLSPFMISRQLSLKSTFVTSSILCIVNIIGFEGGQQLCYRMYCRFCEWTTFDIILIILLALVLYVFVGFSYWYVTNRFIRKNKKTNILYLTLLSILAIPLSILTIHINTGFGTQTEWVDVVKMGYPMFWTTMMMGISGILTASKKSIQNL